MLVSYFVYMVRVAIFLLVFSVIGFVTFVLHGMMVGITLTLLALPVMCVTFVLQIWCSINVAGVWFK